MGTSIPNSQSQQVLQPIESKVNGYTVVLKQDKHRVSKNNRLNDAQIILIKFAFHHTTDRRTYGKNYIVALILKYEKHFNKVLSICCSKICVTYLKRSF